MFVLVSAALAFILSIIVLILDLFILKIALALFVLAMLVVQILSLIGKTNSSTEMVEESEKTLNQSDENRRLSARLVEMAETLRNLSREKEEQEGKIETLLDEASNLCSALPLMNKLSDLVIEKTEESAMNLTENIFNISNRSSQVGTHISSFLNDLFSGDKSLKENIDVLNREMTRIGKLIEDFDAISKHYSVDMKHIEENVLKINSFLTGIRDVSDRTGLLAINSSIEAARVGNAGKGFSVLAGEIQGLASSSKDLSLEIDEVVEIISNRVEESFHTLEAEIKLTLDELHKTQNDLQDITTNLGEKMVNLESHVQDSNTLSKTVTEELNNVSVNMQYQDITRQILEHVMSVLLFYKNQLEEKDPKLIAESDNRNKIEKILKKASSYFTIEDEWKLFGLEAAFSIADASPVEEDFKGDVELF